MATIDLPRLVARLNGVCQKTLEQAAGGAVADGDRPSQLQDAVQGY